MRMIEELGRNLRRAVELRQQRRNQQSRDLTDSIYPAYFSLEPEAVRRLPPDRLLALLEKEAADHPEKYELLADLLLLDGDLLAEANDPNEALLAWKASLYLYTWLQNNVQTVFSFSRIQRLKELEERITGRS